MKVVLQNFWFGKCISTIELPTLEAFIEYSKHCGAEEQSAIRGLLALPPGQEWNITHGEGGKSILAFVVGGAPFNPFRPAPNEFLEQIRRVVSHQD